MTDRPPINIELVEGYALLLAENYDTVQECCCTEIPPALAQRLELAKNAALERHEGQGAHFDFGGHEFQIWTGGSQGNRWVLENDDIQFHFRTDKPGWNISIRYLAAGLWEHGIDALRARAFDILLKEITPLVESWVKLSRLDYAFDFYSPEFGDEQIPGLLASHLCLTSGVKAGIVFSSVRNETLTIGMSKASLQIQVYDKGKEIKDKKGKEWFYKIWERNKTYFPAENEKGRDVWRVEIRFGGEYLKDRKIYTFEDFRENRSKLICKALIDRRLVIPQNNDHRERWDMHPMWAAVYHAAGYATEYLPVGRQITMKKAEYKKMLMKQAAGLGRALSVVEAGLYDRHLAGAQAEQAIEIALEDEKHVDKVRAVVERMRFINEAK